MSEAWNTKGLTTTQKMVLLCLCDFANDEGYCWPRVRTIGEKCDLTDRAVQYNIANLVKAKAVEVLPRFSEKMIHTANLYFVRVGGGERIFTIEESMGCKPMVNGDAPGVVNGDAPLYNHHINHQKDILSIEPQNLILFPEDKEDALKIIDNRFEEFWTIYPRHDGKSQSKRIWDRKKYSNFTIDLIMKAVENQKKGKNCLAREKEYIPYATTWLNKERYLDEVQEDLGFGYVR